MGTPPGWVLVPIWYHSEVGGTHFFKDFCVPSVMNLSRIAKIADITAGKSITLDMPEIDGYTFGVGFSIHLIPLEVDGTHFIKDFYEAFVMILSRLKK